MIGNRIWELRLTRNLTQEALANKLFISPQAVSKWEQGITVPDTSLLVPLADLLGVTVDFLLRDSSRTPSLDILSLLEISVEIPGGTRVMPCTIKNTSKYGFKYLEFKAKFKDCNGQTIDYCVSSISDLSPNDTKVTSVVTSAFAQATDAEIEVLKYSLY